ncbi:MAG: MBL fold metallo-hydrolase [Bacteroidales bacterium]
MKLYAIDIVHFKIDGGAMFGVVPKTMWERKYPADEKNLCTWTLRSLLVDTGERVVLFDNGYGDKQDEKFLKHVHLHDGDGLIDGLAKVGYAPEDITDMVHTHLHADHCGGGVRYGNNGESFEMVFPNAHYWISKPQWESAMHPNPQEVAAFLPENLKPIEASGQLRLLEEGQELCEGVELRLFNGHTRGQLIPFVETNNGKKLVFTADLIPSTAHLPLVWNMAYDIDPLQTIKEKGKFLKEALANDYVLMFQHDLYNECVTLMDTEKGPKVKESFSLKNLYL